MANSVIPFYIEEERDAVHRDFELYREKKKRLLVVQSTISSADEDEIRKSIAAALILNFMLLEVDNKPIIKLFEFSAANGTFTPEESHSILNYSKALLSGGYASLDNFNVWLDDVEKTSALKGSIENYSRLKNFLNNCSLREQTSFRLDVAEAYLSVADSGEDSDQLFRVKLREEMNGRIESGETFADVSFDQFSNQDEYKALSDISLDTFWVQLDMEKLMNSSGVFSKLVLHFNRFDLLRD